MKKLVLMVLLAAFAVGCTVAKKHRCSNTYVKYIIKGRRGAKSEKAQKIVKDLNALLDILRPET